MYVNIKLGDDMKKVMIGFLISLLFISNVYAEKCEVVSGNGTDVGSEIACGSEHFYVMDSSDGNTKMLAKYNLYIGEIYDKKDANGICPNGYETSRVVGFCYKGINDYYNSPGNGKRLYLTAGDYSVYYESTFTIKQDKTAIGAHGDKRGKPEFPEIAVGTLFPIAEMNIGAELDNYLNNSYYDSNKIYDIGYDIIGYKNTLDDMGIDVVSVKMPSLEDIDRVIRKTSGKTIPISTWINKTVDPSTDNIEEYLILGDLKDYITSKYDWLYSTTYWLRTIRRTSDDMTNKYDDDAFFIDTLGYLCTGDDCQIVGAGTRPVVTIKNENIIYPYNIEKKTDGNGSIEVVKSAYADEVITFRVTPKKDFKLVELKITDTSGKTVSFKEDQIIKNSDGTISINSFTMPSSDVLIEAVFKTTITNPDTGVNYPLLGIIILLSICVGMIIYTEKNQKSL